MNIFPLAPSFPIGFADVTPHLPAGWDDQIERVVDQHARRALLTGDDPSSLEPAGSEIEYQLVDGIVVADELAWLEALYRGPWLAAASSFCGAELTTALDPRVGVNLNSLRSIGSRYEWHHDTNPCTGLLFVTTHERGDGGDLVFSDGAIDLHIWPRAGTLLIFDARTTPHTVNPLQRPVHRISIPMNFYLAGDPQDRGKLDDYLYRQEGQHE